MSTPLHEQLAAAVREGAKRDGVALVPFITAGFPNRESFAGLLESIAPFAAAIEVGIPFSDPMADGVTIQGSSRVALEAGATPRWVLDELARVRSRVNRPIVLMSYLNPLLALGGDLAALCERANVGGVIIPDLPLEESTPVRAAINSRGVGVVQMVTPMSDAARLGELAQATQGYLYAVTRTGVTGAGSGSNEADLSTYLAACRHAGPAPVCAGFGIRSAADVRRLASHADGAIVGSALVEVIARGGDPAAFLASLRSA